MAAQAAEGGGAVLSAGGALYAGQMQAGALNAQANLQRDNAALDLEAGNANAARIQIMGGQKLGSIASEASAAGVTQSGSVLSVMAASAFNNEMDRQNELHGADVKAVNADNQASMDELGAKSALQGSYFTALGDILKGAGEIGAQGMGGGAAAGASAGASAGSFGDAATNMAGGAGDTGGSSPAWFFGNSPSPYSQPSTAWPETEQA